MKRKLLTGYLAAAFSTAAVLGYLGCGSSGPGNSNSDGGCTTCNLPSFAGSWTGTWHDMRYDVSGAITATLTVSGSAFNGTGTIDLRSLSFGMQNGTAAGTISGNTVTFTFTSAAVGSGNGTLTGTSGMGSGTVTAGGFGAFTFTGTISDTVIDGTFNFTSPSGGHGTIHLTKS